MVGGVIPREFIPAIQKGIEDQMQNGVLAGYPLIGLKATVYDGSYHDVDSSEMAFKIAASMATKQLSQKGGAVLLEPVMKVEVVTPEDYMGDVMGDLNRRRGLIQGMEDTPAGKVIRAEVPLGEMFGYATDVRSMSQGARATRWSSFAMPRYRPAWPRRSSPGRAAESRRAPPRPAAARAFAGAAAASSAPMRLPSGVFDAPWMLNYKTVTKARTYTVTRMANRCLLQRLPAVPQSPRSPSIS